MSMLANQLTVRWLDFSFCARLPIGRFSSTF